MAPAATSGPLLLDLFDRLPSVRVGFTTQTHFSRPHLELAEAAAVAVATGDFRRPADVAARLGPAEVQGRRAVLRALRGAVARWAGPDWDPRALRRNGVAQG
jgi:hypothetical protein